MRRLPPLNALRAFEAAARLLSFTRAAEELFVTQAAISHQVKVIEEYLGKPAIKNLLPLQPGDVPDTYADVDNLVRDMGYQPRTTVEEGVGRFLDWYREFYGK